MLAALDSTWKGRTAWCVPSAFALLTGCTTASAHERFAFIGDEPVLDLEGVAMGSLLAALGQEGFRCTPLDLVRRHPGLMYGPTLPTFWGGLTSEERMSPLLVLLPGHVITSHMGWAADNWTRRPVPHADFPKPRRNVQAAWMVRRWRPAEK